MRCHHTAVPHLSFVKKNIFTLPFTCILPSEFFNFLGFLLSRLNKFDLNNSHFSVSSVLNISSDLWYGWSISRYWKTHLFKTSLLMQIHIYIFSEQIYKDLSNCSFVKGQLFTIICDFMYWIGIILHKFARSTKKA